MTNYNVVISRVPSPSELKILIGHKHKHNDNTTSTTHVAHNKVFQICNNKTLLIIKVIIFNL